MVSRVRVNLLACAGCCCFIVTACFSQVGHAFDDWRSIRDRGIVKQQRDYSCGAAALATVLTYFYADAVSEETLLRQIMDYRDSLPNSGVDDPGVAQFLGLSFADMARLARSRSYPVVGLDIAYSDLKNLTVPAIVALNVEGRAHFSVLRRADDHDRVFLADPSWGNLQLSRSEFLSSFSQDAGGERGRVLIVGSRDETLGDKGFLHRPPRRVLVAPRL